MCLFHKDAALKWKKAVLRVINLFTIPKTIVMSVHKVKKLPGVVTCVSTTVAIPIAIRASVRCAIRVHYAHSV